MYIFTFILLVISSVLFVDAKSSTGDSVLVLVDPSKRDDYSIFFDGLKEKGYELTFRGAKEEKPLVIEDDQPMFNHVILLDTNTKAFAKDLTPQNIVKLLSLNTNVLVAASTKQNFLTSLAAEFSLIPPPPGTPLLSYFPERDDPATVIPISVPATSSILTPNTADIWFSGIPFALGSNPMLVPILHAPSEAFAAEIDSGQDALVDAADKGGEGLWAGKQLGVVVGFQALGNARITWVGGPEVFGDNFAVKEVAKGVTSGNKQFAQDVAAWTFQESLVLRIDSTTHSKVNSSTPQEAYTTTDELVFTAHISKYNPTTSSWEPYSDLRDLQLEFTMLDPFIRTALPSVPGSPGEYSVSFKAPDRHGVFKFVIDYKRRGWTHLQSSTTVSLVPPRHDGYPRFLSVAWPYYTGAISTSIAFVLFSAIWLAGDVSEIDGKGKKKKE